MSKNNKKVEKNKDLFNINATVHPPMNLKLFEKLIVSMNKGGVAASFALVMHNQRIIVEKLDKILEKNNGK